LLSILGIERWRRSSCGYFSCLQNVITAVLCLGGISFLTLCCLVQHDHGLFQVLGLGCYHPLLLVLSLPSFPHSLLCLGHCLFR
uniref:Uncharacterized protein n=1 Tax=Amphimedon queenslandica TaxID=400682 RepID=A0A1X7VJ69_AMPQE